MLDLLEELVEVESVKLAHPLKLRAIAVIALETDEIERFLNSGKLAA
jgi:hypothetical protein